MIAATHALLLAPNEIWHDATPDATVEAATVLTQKVVSEDIIQTVSVQSVSSGEIEYYCIWFPLSPESSVVAA